MAAHTVPKAAAGCLVGAAFAAYADGRLPTAIDHIRTALSHDPDLAEAHWNLGRYLWQAGKLQEAAEGSYRALSINPNYATRFNDDEALQEPAEEAQRLQANLIQAFRQRFDRDRLSRVRQEAKLLSKCIIDLGLDDSTMRNIEGRLNAFGTLAESEDVLLAAKLGTSGENAANQLYNDMNRERSSLHDHLNREMSQMSESIKTERSAYRSNIMPVTYGLGLLLSGVLMWSLYAASGASLEISASNIFLLIGWPLVSLVCLFDLLLPTSFLPESPLPFLSLGYAVLPVVSFGAGLLLPYFGFVRKTHDLQQRGVRLAEVKATLGALRF